jgi:hypothetical protein
MIFWSLQQRSINLGQCETQWCAKCGGQRPFSILFNYKCFRLYWLFGVVFSRRYLKRCACCGGGWQLDPKNINARSPIPFMQRFGLLTLIAALAVIGIAITPK